MRGYIFGDSSTTPGRAETWEFLGDWRSGDTLFTFGFGRSVEKYLRGFDIAKSGL